MIRNFMVMAVALQAGARAATPLQQDGVEVLRSVLDPGAVDKLRDAYAHTHHHPPLAEAWLGQNIPHDMLWLENDMIWDAWTRGPVVSRVAHAAGAARVALLTDFFLRVAAGRRPVAVGQWHVDSTSFDIVDAPTEGVTAWIPLQDIDAARDGGSLCTVNRTAPLSPECTTPHGGTFPPQCNAEFRRYQDVRSWKKGDVLLFTSNTVHRTQPMAGGHHAARTVLVGRFLLGKPRFRAPRSLAWFTQRKNLCNHGLRPGDPMVSHCFPQVHPATPPAHRYMRRTRRTRAPHAGERLWALLRRMASLFLAPALRGGAGDTQPAPWTASLWAWR